MYMYMYMYTDTGMHVFTHTYTWMCAHIVHIHVHTHTLTHTHTYIILNTHILTTYAHTHISGISEWIGQVWFYRTALGGQWWTHRYCNIIYTVYTMIFYHHVHCVSLLEYQCVQLTMYTARTLTHKPLCTCTI